MKSTAINTPTYDAVRIIIRCGGFSALEVDEDFNVNVLTGSDGVIRGAVGGHPIPLLVAALTVVVPFVAGENSCVVEE
jgi:citrate lyase subunit alpha/citrate CoA-transferase